MPYTADAVANEFLTIAEASSAQITPMKLQKLVYYAHGWHLAFAPEPLIRESVQAWKYGPVIPSLYHEFKDFGNEPINRRAKEAKWSDAGGLSVFAPSLDLESQSEEPLEFARALIKRIWELYSPYTAVQLSRMTHAEGTPWYQVASKFELDPPPGINIPNELIAKHFKDRLVAAQKSDFSAAESRN